MIKDLLQTLLEGQGLSEAHRDLFQPDKREQEVYYLGGLHIPLEIVIYWNRPLEGLEKDMLYPFILSLARTESEGIPKLGAPLIEGIVDASMNVESVNPSGGIEAVMEILIKSATKE